MVEDNNLSEIMNAFNIPEEENSLEEEKSATENDVKTSDKFDELSTEVSETISGLEQKGSSVKENNNSVIESSKEDSKEDFVARIANEIKHQPSVDCFDEIDNKQVVSSSNFEEVENENLEASVHSEENRKETQEEAKEVVKDETVEEKITKGKIDWKIESPSALYDEFYRLKRQKYYVFTGGYPLDYDYVEKELIKCRVDTSTEVLDKILLLRKLDEVVQAIDRVTMLKIKINDQYFVWKRFIEIIRGELARVEYLKPQAKQDGLVGEHLGDIEYYVTRLEILHEDANEISKTLDKAFETLNRKVTVVLSLDDRDIDRKETEHRKPSSSLKHLINYDEVPMGTEVITEKQNGREVRIGDKKPGEMEWGDF